MANYIFETITAAQALAYNATNDTLVFTNPTSHGSAMTVIYTAGTALTAPSVTLSDNADGKSVVFGTGIYGEGETGTNALVFPDGSNLVIGSDTAVDTTSISTTGADGMFGGGGNDSLAGEGGDDSLVGAAGNDTIDGGDGNDTITGAAGTNAITGGNGNDSIDLTGGPTASASSVDGNAGNDTITDNGTGLDTILGGQGNDSINATGSATGVTKLLDGNLGNDTIVGTGAGTYKVLGEDGNDSIDFSAATGKSTFDGGVGNDVIKTGDGADTVTGNDGNDSITTGNNAAGGNNSIDGGNGNDSMSLTNWTTGTGSGGHDTVTGGAGDDTITTAASHGGSLYQLGDGNDSINASNDATDSIVTSDSISAGTGNDSVTGSATLANNLDGGDGNDTIVGGANQDTITGGLGNDTIAGGGGTDVLSGGGGGDLFIWSAGSSQVSSGKSVLGVGGVAAGIDQIRDWNGGTTAAPTNFIVFGAGSATAATYSETTGTDFNDAVAQANGHLGNAGKYIAVQVGTDVVVFADTNADHSITGVDDAVTLVGKTLNDIDFSNIVG